MSFLDKVKNNCSSINKIFNNKLIIFLYQIEFYINCNS